jgi:hypothetical protein
MATVDWLRGLKFNFLFGLNLEVEFFFYSNFKKNSTYFNFNLIKIFWAWSRGQTFVIEKSTLERKVINLKKNSYTP